MQETETSKRGFTPGPWGFGEHGTYASDGPTNYRIQSSATFIADTTGYSLLDEANARLIAAAPELLTALEGLRAAIDGLHEDGYIRDDDIPAGYFITERFADAAIAKARGQS